MAKNIPVYRKEFKDMKNTFEYVHEYLDIIVEHNEEMTNWEFFVRTPFAECEDCFFALKTQRGKNKVYRTFEAMMKDMKSALSTSVDYMESKGEGLKLEIRETGKI